MEDFLEDFFKVNRQRSRVNPVQVGRTVTVDFLRKSKLSEFCRISLTPILTTTQITELPAAFGCISLTSPDRPIPWIRPPRTFRMEEARRASRSPQPIFRGWFWVSREVRRERRVRI